MQQQQLIRQQFAVMFNYDIIFTNAVFDLSNHTLINVINKEPARHTYKIVVVIDDALVLHEPGLAEKITRYFTNNQYPVSAKNILIVPGGESVKNNADSLEQMLELVNSNKVDRHSFLIAIGGGAVLDVAGYAAAIAHRGVRLIRIPTTVLSQNDSGVGVKNGINYFGKKNFLGTFMPPFAVINDSDFLTSLSQRHWRSGISEAVKVALIKDADFFNWIEENAAALNHRNMQLMEQLIFRCAVLHAAHISGNGDPFEKGSSRPLDFGHWAAHKLEHLSGYEVTHGEAVAIGIALDATYSFLAGLLDSGSLDRILNCLSTLGFAVSHPIFSDQPAALLAGLEEFREHLGGALTVTLLSSIGTGMEVHHIDVTHISDAVSHLHAFSNSTYSAV